MRDLVVDTDWSIGEWPSVLRQRFRDAWSRPLRALVLEVVGERSRAVDFRAATPREVATGRAQVESDKALFLVGDRRRRR